MQPSSDKNRPAEPLARDSMADRVKRALMERILSGRLAPGTRLIELQLAREFNTSQGPVREALRELEALHLVQTEAYKGSRVRQADARDMREAYQVRALLEQYAGRRAAKYLKGNTGHLKALAERIRQAAAAGDVEEYALHDMEFHRTIVESARNGILLRTWDSLAFEVRIRVFLTRGQIDLTEAQRVHPEIVAALEAGDGRLAGRLLREHLLGFARQSRKRSPKAT